MEEPKKQNPQSQASTRQSEHYEIFGDETERLKRYPKADPPPPPVKCEFCNRTLYAHGYELGQKIHWSVMRDATARKQSPKQSVKRLNGWRKKNARRKPNAIVNCRNE